MLLLQGWKLCWLLAVAATPGGPEDVTKATLLVLQWGCVLQLTSYLISSLLA